MIIELTEQQIQNLKVFLERITLQPKEIQPYIEIINALTNTKAGEDNGS